jgi:hypothetical protein
MKKLEAIGFSFIGIALFLFFMNLNLFKINECSINGNVIQNKNDYNTLVSKNISVILSSVFFLYGIFMFLLSGLEKKVQEDKKMISKVKEDPFLLRVARDIGKNPVIRKEINHLMNELYKGNINPGLGTKYVDNNLKEMRGRNGARVYYRMNSFGEYEILGYSDKDTQTEVINRLKILYGD